MSSDEVDTGAADVDQDKPETDMTDPENYGSLSIEDPDGDVTENGSTDEVSATDHPTPAR